MILPDLVAILRGVRPDEVEAIGTVLIDAGFEGIEVPLNSPDPFASISRLASRFGSATLIGAGTVLSRGEVEQVNEAGGRLVVSPNCDPEVIAYTKTLGLASLPGVATATECFAALKVGADGLKLFPGDLVGPAGAKAFSAVLPSGTKLYAVGGADASNVSEWVSVGVKAFGVGSAIYRPGWTADEVARAARDFVESYRACAGSGQ